ncbi:MAG TPA: adenosylcobinamide-phosphate synthase CbiB, partial [Stenomitos sp.]
MPSQPLALIAEVAALGYSSAGILIISALLDFIIGDPWRWPHPVQGMGWVIRQVCRVTWRWVKHPLGLRIAGVGLGLGLVLGSASLAWMSLYFAFQLWVPGGWLLEVVLLASCFAGRSLRAAATDVLDTLKRGSLEDARLALSRYVGRDTTDLSEPEILRAVLETVAENSTDGVMAPLFYAALGSFLPTGPLPLAIAYKAASTLDSMVGYRDTPYTDLGWFSAKLDDVLTWVPCRLNVITLGLISGKMQTVWRLCRQDAHKDASPNSGWSECAYAAI